MPKPLADKLRDRLSAVVAAGLILATVLALSASFGFLGELACHFRPHLGVACLLGAAWFALRRAARVAVACLCLAALHLAPALALFLPSGESGGGEADLSVVSVNLFQGEGDRERLEAWLDSTDPDLICMQEVMPPWYGWLEEREADYPYQAFWPMDAAEREEVYGMAILSRYPLTDLEEVHRGDWPRPILATSVEVGEERVRLIAAHPMRAGKPWRLAQRDDCLFAAADLAAGEPRALLVGDLNLTAYSPVFRGLLERGELRDSRRGFGWQPTWSAAPFSPLAFLPLDHFLVGRGLGVVGRSVGPHVESDHRPIVVGLTLR